jgi:hypothetical protein
MYLAINAASTPPIPGRGWAEPKVKTAHDADRELLKEWFNS